MELALVGTLAALALVDSTSFGTLGIPVVMLVQRRVRVRAYAVYLATISLFYAALGIVLLFGANALVGLLRPLAEHPVVPMVELGLGVSLFAGSFLIDTKGRAWRRRRRAARGLPDLPDRQERWRARLLGAQADTRAVAGLALGAGLVEAASMLPYLGAIGLLTAAAMPVAAKVGTLVGYVVLMALPALLLLALRLVAARAVAPVLDRIDGWMRRNADEVLGWTVGIVGLLLALDAWPRLAATGSLFNAAGGLVVGAGG